MEAMCFNPRHVDIGVTGVDVLATQGKSTLGMESTLVLLEPMNLNPRQIDIGVIGVDDLASQDNKKKKSNTGCTVHIGVLGVNESN